MTELEEFQKVYDLIKDYQWHAIEGDQGYYTCEHPYLFTLTLRNITGGEPSQYYELRVLEDMDGDKIGDLVATYEYAPGLDFGGQLHRLYDDIQRDVGHRLNQEREDRRIRYIKFLEKR